MKTIITLILAAVCLSAFAADEPKAQSASAFKGNELSVDLFGGVISPDLDDETTTYGFGLQYYTPWIENLGAGVYTTFTDLSGHTPDNVSARLLWRVPVADKHAFYAHGGGTRYFHDETGWNLILGPGYSYRPFAHIEFWGEVGMDKEITGEDRDLAATARAGVRLTW